MKWISLSILFIVLGCQTTRRATTPPRVELRDLARFGFHLEPGPVVVLHVFRVSCPYCREDIRRLADNFVTQRWSAGRVRVLLLAYRKPGVDDREGFATYLREDLPKFPAGVLDVRYVDEDYFALSSTRGAGGEFIFRDWRAVPFGMIFDARGHLVYADHFTVTESAARAHDQLVTDLQN